MNRYILVQEYIPGYLFFQTLIKCKIIFRLQYIYNWTNAKIQYLQYLQLKNRIELTYIPIFFYIFFSFKDRTSIKNYKCGFVE